MAAVLLAKRALLHLQGTRQAAAPPGGEVLPLLELALAGTEALRVQDCSTEGLQLITQILASVPAGPRPLLALASATLISCPGGMRVPVLMVLSLAAMPQPCRTSGSRT